MNDLELRRSQLGPMTDLGKGGTAFVYRLRQRNVDPSNDVVYKQYRRGIRQRAGPGLKPGLVSIVNLLGQLHPEQRRSLEQRTIWPMRVVVEDSPGTPAVGIIMRLIPSGYFQQVTKRLGSVTATPRELQLLQKDDEDARRMGLAPVSVHDRILICAQVARTLAMLHRADVVFGDVSPRNAVFKLDGRAPEVLFVDCDSVRVRGTRSPFGAQAHTPFWLPPEAEKAQRALQVARRRGSPTSSELTHLSAQQFTQNKATDVYKFALLVARLLDNGRNTSQSKDASKAVRILREVAGREAADVLLQMLSPSPKDRPSVRDWYDALFGRAPRDRDSPRAKGGEAASRDQSRVVSPSPTRSACRTTVPPAPPSGNWQWEEGVGWRRVQTS